MTMQILTRMRELFWTSPIPNGALILIAALLVVAIYQRKDDRPAPPPSDITWGENAGVLPAPPPRANVMIDGSVCDGREDIGNHFAYDIAGEHHEYWCAIATEYDGGDGHLRVITVSGGAPLFMWKESPVPCDDCIFIVHDDGTTLFEMNEPGLYPKHR